MPAKNSLKQYVEKGYYHVYNRGVAKNPIFLKEEDYSVFLSFLREYLSPFNPPTEGDLRAQGYTYFRKNYSQEIELIAFCLMPNHFHLLLKQNSSRSVEHFMRSLLIRYSYYFNKEYERVGHLFQDVYKGILVEREEYFLWLTRYIHRNPLELMKGSSLSIYPYSSYPTYLGEKVVDWVKPDSILKQVKNYRSFVEYADEKELEELKLYTLES